MAKIVVKNAVKRKKGYLYFIDKEGNICMTKMSRGKKAKKKKVK